MTARLSGGGTRLVDEQAGKLGEKMETTALCPRLRLYRAKGRFVDVLPMVCNRLCRASSSSSSSGSARCS